MANNHFNRRTFFHKCNNMRLPWPLCFNVALCLSFSILNCWCLMARAKLNEKHSFVLSQPFFFFFLAHALPNIECNCACIYRLNVLAVKFFKWLLFHCCSFCYRFSLSSGFGMKKKCVANLRTKEKRRKKKKKRNDRRNRRILSQESSLF